MTGMDFSYFSPAPPSYQYYNNQTSVTDDDYNYEAYGQSQEHFDAAFPTFQEPLLYDMVDTSTRPPSLPNYNPVSPVLEGPVSEENRPTSSSEEKDYNPQQDKRKAQNRAAQRAFRERKEKRVKDLEARSADLQQRLVNLDGENERLRKELAKFETENEILRATTGQLPEDDLFNHIGYRPMSKKPKELRTKFPPLHAIVIDDSSGEPLLTAAQTWDYIQAHETFRKGLVDVGDVCETLKKLARCHGQGPVFRECDIRQAIEQSAVAGGRDELI